MSEDPGKNPELRYLLFNNSGREESYYNTNRCNYNGRVKSDFENLFDPGTKFDGKKSQQEEFYCLTDECGNNKN